MKKELIFIIISLSCFNANAQKQPAKEEKDGERLGLRIGYARTNSKIDGSFGPGLSLAFHFLEKAKTPLFIDFNLGAFYMGETSRPDITEKIIGHRNYTARMRIVFFTAAPTIETSISEKFKIYFSAGAGLYSVTILLDAGLFFGDITDNHLGVNSGAGVLFPVSSKISLDFNLALHHFWTSSRENDIFYSYSEGDKNPNYYQISIGAVLSIP